MNKDREERAVLHLPKVDYNGTGSKRNAVDMEITLRHVGPRAAADCEPLMFQTVTHEHLAEYTDLSVCGFVWNHIHTDIVSGGQNIEEIAAFFPRDKRAQRIAEIWREWHLNGMTAGCIHQPEAWTCTNTRDRYADKVGTITGRIIAMRAEPATAENAAAIAAAEKDRAALVDAEQKAHEGPEANGWGTIHAIYGEHPYPHRGDSCHVCGRSRWDEPTDACPETGYRYGTAWLVRALPAEIIAEIRGLVTFTPRRSRF